MKRCECVPTCLFFNDQMADMPAMAEVYKRNYCRGHSSACARHTVFQVVGSNEVPEDLYPNEYSRAAELVSERLCQQTA